jgi:hypothetical protein
MKNQFKVVMFVISVVILVGASGFCAEKSGGKPSIVEPKSKSTVENRRDFSVAGSIPDYESTRKKNLHYWITLASVKANSKPHMHWPKFYVKSAQFKGRIFDGGENPFSKPQPMIILLLKVNDSTNQQFELWLEKGKNSGHYEGIPIDSSQITASVPIYFP